MRLFIAVAAATMLFASVAKAETIRILMETVPDTRYIQELLPEFEEASGIDVEIEAISYIDMHSKLVPQLISPQGSYDLIVVDFYWVGEFTKAGWLMPLDDLAARDGVDVDVYVPKLMDLVGRVDGVLYMLPFYNYSMAVIYRQDLIDDPAEQAAFKEQYGIDLRVPETWDEYWKQVQFFTRDNDGDGDRDFYGTVIQGQRGDCISMQWANYLYAQGGRYHDENWNPLLDSPEAIRAMEYYRDAVVNYSPAGSEAYCFDEAFNVMAQGQGLQLRHLQHPLRRLRGSRVLRGGRQSRHRPQSGRRPERRLGLGHPQLEPERGSGVDLHQVGRVCRCRQAARSARRRSDAGADLHGCRCRGGAALLPDPRRDPRRHAGLPGLHLHDRVRGGSGPRAEPGRDR